MTTRIFGSSLLFDKRDDLVFYFGGPLINYLSLDLSSTPGGIYYFNTFWVGSSAGASSISNQLSIDGSVFYSKISGRANPSDSRQKNNLQRQITIPAGSQSLDMAFTRVAGGGGGGATMYQCRMTLWRIS